MDVLFIPMIMVLMTVINLYTWVVIAAVVLSWLTTFHVINTHNRFVYMAASFLYRATDPMLSRIRQIIPGIAGIDVSPMILILSMYFIQGVLERLVHKFY